MRAFFAGCLSGLGSAGLEAGWDKCDEKEKEGEFMASFFLGGDCLMFPMSMGGRKKRKKKEERR
jgi:hypothetical protein